MREGKRARDEGREIFKGRPFRALWAMGRSQRAFTLSGMGATEELGTEGDVSLGVGSLSWLPWQEETVCLCVCVGGGGRREGRLL